MMADLDKVLKGLEHCLSDNVNDCENCPYRNGDSVSYPCGRVLKMDAIELLKSQQAEIERLKARLNVYEWENGDRKDGDGECAE